MANSFFKLVNCINNQVVYTDDSSCPDCAGSVGDLVYTNLDPVPCWYVFNFDSTPSIITPVIIFYELQCGSCVPKCYTITGTGNVSYVTISDGYIIETATAPVKICSYSYPTVLGLDNEIFTNDDECSYRYGCPTVCYELTNCDTDEVIYSYNQDLAFPYTLNQTVKLAEFTGCWTIALVTCNEELPYVSTTVTQTFDSCTTCNPPNYYKLESCGSSQPLTKPAHQSERQKLQKPKAANGHSGSSRPDGWSNDPHPIQNRIRAPWVDPRNRRRVSRRFT